MKLNNAVTRRRPSRRTRGSAHRQSPGLLRTGLGRFETLEDRVLLAAELRLISILQPDGSRLEGGEQFSISPSEFTFVFNEGQSVDPSTLSGIQITASGSDGAFGDANDVSIAPGFVGLGSLSNEVIVRFRDTLPDDTYQILIAGSGPAPLKSVDGEAFNDGQDLTRTFDLDLGAQVVAVTPQPVTRDATGKLVQELSQIVVYFNSDTLDATSAENPAFYQLIHTQGTLDAVDDAVQNPVQVTYDAADNSALLEFGVPLAAGSYRLRIGNDDPLPIAPVAMDVLPDGAEANSSFDTSELLGTLGDAGLIVTSSIDGQEFGPFLPGGVNEPGHRDLPSVPGESHVGGSGSSAGGGFGDDHAWDWDQLDPIAFGESRLIIAPHHAEPGHPGSPNTHYFAETGDEHHFAWVDRVPATAKVVDIYYDYRSHNGFANQITAGQLAMAEAALQAWENATNGALNFIRNTSAPASEIVNIGTGDLAALGGTSGPGGTLGLGGGTFIHDVNHRIQGGIAWQDVADSWDESFGNGNPGGTFDYFTVVAQEIGHAIGLGHTNDLAGPDLMDGFYGGEQTEASSNDREHVQSLYGSFAPGITTAFYNFKDVYGTDPQGNILHNVITAAQKQRAREIFALYNHFLGIQFVETPASGITVVTGDLRAVAPSIPTGPGGVAGISSGGLGGLAIMDAAENWGDSEYGGSWFRVAMHEIGHNLGLAHTLDLASLTLMGDSGPAGEPVFPGDNDIVHGQFLWRPLSKDIDLYRFDVTESGVLTAETVAERLAHDASDNDSQLLDSVLTLYREVQVLTVPASGGAALADGQTFQIGDGTRLVTFEFDLGNGVAAGNVAIVFSASDSASSIARKMFTAITGTEANLDLSASVVGRRVEVGGFAQVTNASSLQVGVGRNLVARNDDYFSNDSLIRLALEPGVYYVAVTSSGNTDFDPTIEDSGFGGTTQGPYELRLDFQADPPGSIVDTTGTAIDGDADGDPGGAFNFWFNASVAEPVGILRGTFAGTGSGGLDGPSGMVFGPDGNLYVSSTNTDAVLRYDGDTGALIDAFVPSGAGALDAPGRGLTFGPDGNLYVASVTGDAILKFSGTSGAFMSVFALNPLLVDPQDMVFGPDGNLYVASETVVLRFNGVTGATVGTFVAAADLGPGMGPVSLAFGPDSTGDGVGELFVGSFDGGSNEGEIRRFNGATGALLGVVVDRSTGQLENPSGLAFGSDGNLYVADGIAAGRVVRFNPLTGGLIDTVVAAGSGGLGVAIEAIFGPDGNLYVSNATQDNVLQFAGPGTVNYLNTLFVDKANDLVAGVAEGDGSLGDPFDNIASALAVAGPGDIVRIAGNGGADGDMATLGDNLPYLIGVDNFGTALADGAEMFVPGEVTVMIDAGAVFKLHRANIDVGTSAPELDRSGGALQVLGTPQHNVQFTSWRDDTIGGDTNGAGVAPQGGNWGGLVFREDSDHEQEGIFVNYVGQANLSFGGGQVVVNSLPEVFSPVHLIESRPTILRNNVERGGQLADAAISADPASFEETRFAGYERVGPDIDGNSFNSNSINGVFVRIDTPFNAPTERLQVAARFDDTDIVHVVAENLFIAGTPGGPEVIGGVRQARLDGRLAIDAGIIVKLSGARIEAEIGAQLIAEGLAGKAVVFTSLHDDTYGAGGRFDTNGDGSATSPRPGDWGGLFFRATSKGSLDHVTLAYAGGIAPIEGGFEQFSAVEIHQGDVRIANSTMRDNADGVSIPNQTAPNRKGRGGNAAATIFVRGAQPIIVGNAFDNNVGATIHINANSLNAERVTDIGRSTGSLNRFTQFGDDLRGTADNQGPLVRYNRIDNDPVNDAINGMVVRGATLTTESTWDDTDIVHVLFDEIVSVNHHTVGGVRLQSSAEASLVVKLLGSGAGFTASGTELAVDDRIGGTVQVVGTAQHPVILTTVNDCNVGAGFTLHGDPQTDTANNGLCSEVSVGNSGAVVIDGGDRDDFGHGSALAGPDGVLGTADDINIDGWQFIQQMVEFALAGSRNNAPNELLVIGADPGTQAADAITSVATVLGLGITIVNDAAISSEVFTDYKVIYVPSDENTSGGISTGIFGGVDEIGLLTQRKVDIQTFVNTGGSLVALTEDILTPDAYPWLELPLPFETRSVFGLGTLRKTQAAIDAGFTITDAELSNGVPYHNSFVGPPGFNGLQPFVLDDGLDGIAGNADDEVITLGLASGSFGIGISGPWRGIQLNEFSNDRNVGVANEDESSFTRGLDVNAVPASAQFLGDLAANEQSGDDTLRLGFEAHGSISFDDRGDADVYSFSGIAGTEVWIDIDRTDIALDSVVELIDVNGKVRARSVTNVDLQSFDVLALPMLKDENTEARFGGAGTTDPFDLFTTNPRDPGMRVVLPGPEGTRNEYFIRVRSNSGDLTALHGGKTRGAYQMQVRLRQIDEQPGSTVRHSDISFAERSIEILGLPGHSPLTGESAEAPGDSADEGFGAAQQLGNLLAVDRNTINVGGTLANSTDVDWYQFTANYQNIQSIAGVNAGPKTFAALFDVDYADGLSRANTTIAVFDGSGNLVMLGTDSDLLEDQPGPGEGSDSDDLSRGTFGKLDPFIGTTHIPAGPPGGTVTYSVAVFSNALLPAVLDQLMVAGSATPLARLEPVSSVNRIVEDHVGSIDNAEVPGTGTSQPLFGAPNGSDFSPQALAAHAVPFKLEDVVLFVSSQQELVTVDPFTGATETDVTGPGVGLTLAYGDIAMRSDGLLYGYTRFRPGSAFDDANTGNYIELDTGNGGETQRGDDGIADNPNTVGQDIEAMAFRGGGDSLDDFELFFVNHNSDTDPATTERALWRANADTGLIRDECPANAQVICPFRLLPNQTDRWTGLAFNSAETILYGVTQSGDLYNMFTSNLIRSDVLGGAGFTGLTTGPQNVENGAFANLLFGTTTDGRLVAIDTSGNLRSIFDSNGDGVADSDSVSLSIGSGTTGLAFSPLDYNLWHPTLQRRADAGHGINQTADNSRLDLPASEQEGGTSFYFGFEDPRDPGDVSTLVPQPGASNFVYRQGTRGDVYDTYNLPGGSHGVVVTNPFSLEGYNGTDKPTLYLSYFLDTEGTDSTLADRDAARDVARVFVSENGGATWQSVATNNSLRDVRTAVSELPAFASLATRAASDPRQQVQELFDSTGSWRQTRVDLANYAGQANLLLRFEFSTAGAMNDATRFAGVSGVAVDDFGEFTSNQRGQNNVFEGIYIDDIIIGFAERGEMVTEGGSNTAFFQVPQDPRPDAPSQVLVGPYQLEVRRGQVYATPADVTGDIDIVQTFDNNDRLADGFTLIASPGSAIVDGQSFSLSDGIHTVTFEFDTGNGVAPGLVVPILFNGGETAAEIANLMAAAINNVNTLFPGLVPDFAVRASSIPSSNRVEIIGAVGSAPGGAALNLTADVAVNAVAESGGPGATTVTVTREGSSTGALNFTLSAIDPISGGLTDELTLDGTGLASIAGVIPAGLLSVTFSIDPVDDLVADGTQPVHLVASAPGFQSVTDVVDVTDDDGAALQVVINAPTSIEEPPTVGGGGLLTSVLWVGSSSLGFNDGSFNITQIPVSLLPTANLSNFDVIYVDSNAGGLATLQGLAGTFAAYVSAGGGLITENGGQEFDPDFSWVPNAGAGLAWQAEDEDTVLLTSLGGAHPVTAGLSNAGLSNWAISQHNHFTATAGMDVLATNPGGLANLLADTLGSGQLVYLGMDASGHQFSGQAQDLIRQALRWAGGQIAGSGGPTTTATVTRLNVATNQALEVFLQSMDPGEAVVPASVIIPAGQTSVSFPVAAVGDGINDGDQTVTIAAFASRFSSGSDTLVVEDIDDTPRPEVEIAIGESTGSAGVAVNPLNTTNLVAVSNTAGPAPLPTGPEVDAGFFIDNDVDVATEGHFGITVGDGGRTTAGSATAQGLTGFFQQSDFIVDFDNYVDVGSDGIAVNLASSVTTTALRPSAEDLVFSTGSFFGDAGQTIFWTAQTELQDGLPVAISTITFTSAPGTTLGDLRYVNYLDEGLATPTDDVLVPTGTPGEASFRAFSLDGPERVGLSQGGVYSAGPRLENATYDGWAADRAADLLFNITGPGTTYSIAGNIDTSAGNLPETPPGSGEFGPGDVSTAFAWTVNPAATTATITTFLQLLGSDLSDRSPMRTSTSFDSGNTWDPVPIGTAEDGLPFDVSRSDPNVAFDSDGNAYVVYSAETVEGESRLMLAKSTDGGRTYTQSTMIASEPQAGALLTPAVTTRENPAGDDGVLVVWAQSNGTNESIKAALSTDGGATFGTVNNRINQGALQHTLFPWAAVDGAGNFHVVWESAVGTAGTVYHDVLDGATLADGTETVVINSNVTDFAPIAAQPDQGIWSRPTVDIDRSGGAFDGRVYVSYTDRLNATTDDTDVFARFSVDGGATWATPVKVNDDGGTNSQFLPRLAVDQITGAVAMLWYDARNDVADISPGDIDTDGVANTEVQPFTAVSPDGGMSYAANEVEPDPNNPSAALNQSASNPTANPANFGDYLGLAVHNGALHSVWNSSSSGLDELVLTTNSTVSEPQLRSSDNVNVTDSFSQEVNVSLDVDPANRHRLVATTTRQGIALDDQVWFSQDGGLSWTEQTPADPLGGVDGGFPSVVFDRNGTAYFAHLDTTFGIVAAANVGGTWLPPAIVSTPAGTTLGKPFLAVGPDVDDLTRDRVYLGYTADGVTYINSFDGVAWSAPQVVGDAGSSTNSQLAVGPAGEVYYIWENFATAGVGRVMMDTSLDGGVNWSADNEIYTSNVNVFNDQFSAGFGVDGVDEGAANDGLGDYEVPAQPDQALLMGVSIDVDRTNNRIYIVLADQADRDGSPDPTNSIDHHNTDVFLIRSGDGGATFSAPTRVNDDLGTTSQFLPWVDVDQTTGAVAVAWYDGRDGGTQNRTVATYAAVSITGGAAFLPNVRVAEGQSNQSLDNAGRSLRNYGEYLGLAFNDGFAHVGWLDNSGLLGTDPANLDVFYATVTLVTEDHSLIVDIAAPMIAENGGTTTATITRNGNTDLPLFLRIEAIDPTTGLPTDELVVVPPAGGAVIPAGQTSITVTIRATDDFVADGTQPVVITARAFPFDSISDFVDVTDDEVPILTVTVTPSAVDENAGPLAVVGTVTRNTPLDEVQVVHLISSDTSEATVPPTVTILAGQASASFPVIPVDELVSDGTRNVTIFGVASRFLSGRDDLAVRSVSNLQGFRRTGDKNLLRDQGHIVIEANVINQSAEFGIIVDAGQRTSADNRTHGGPPLNVPTLNTARLVPGVTIVNNVVAGFGTAGIRFAGDPNAGSGPIAPVPFGRIVNNTVYGGSSPTGTGIQVINNASPTILNNIVSNVQLGISIDASSLSLPSRPVVGTTLYFGVPSGQETDFGNLGTFAIVAQPGVEVQTVAISGSPTGGTYRLRVDHPRADILIQTTGPIAWNANAAAVQFALRQLQGFGSVTVSSTGTSPNFTHTVTFNGVQGNVPQMTALNSLTGGTPVITLATTRQGVVPLFVDPDNGNFYLNSGVAAIDSSLNALVDRPESVVVKQPVGIPESPVLAPAQDAFGQLRVDDPNQAPPPGLGSNIFKDRGAIERADTSGPRAILINPADDPTALAMVDFSPDLDSRSHQVIVNASFLLSRFDIQLLDGAGVGIDDLSVNAPQFLLELNGTPLVEGTDYFFAYNEFLDVVSLISTGGRFGNGDYTITIDTDASFDVDNDPDTGVRDLAGNLVELPNPPVFTVIVDVVKPRARVTSPLDNGSNDVAPGIDLVVVDAAQSQIVIELTDSSGVLDQDTVALSGTPNVPEFELSVTRDPRAGAALQNLVRNVDYSFFYDRTTDEIILTPLAPLGNLFIDGLYTIMLGDGLPGGLKDIADVAENVLANPTLRVNVREVGTILTESAGSTDVAEEGQTSDTYQFVLTSEPTDDVTVTINFDASQITVNGNTSGSVQLTFTSDPSGAVNSWQDAQTIVVTAVDDVLPESDPHQTVITYVLTSLDVLYAARPVAPTTVNIAENDEPALIEGRKYEDLDGDGISDPGEPGLPGWTIFLDLDGNGALGAGDLSTTTDATGAYSLRAPTVGTFTVAEVQQAGWVQTAPVGGTYAVTITAAGQIATGNDFGNFREARIRGRKFEDSDRNGVQDAGEAALAGWTIFLDGDGDGLLSAGERNTLTDASGNYEFDSLGPAVYSVAEVIQPGWIQTFPASGSHTVTVNASGQTLAGNDFGNFQELIFGPEFVVNSIEPGSQRFASIAVADNGSFVAAWAGPDGSDFGVFARRFDAAGQPLGPDIQVNTITADRQWLPSVAMRPGGGFIVTWTSFNQDRTPRSVYARLFNSSGVAQGGEFRVNILNAGSQTNSTVASDAAGNFTVVWTSFSSTTVAGDVYARRFDSSGAGLGDQFQVNTFANAGQGDSALAMDPDGNSVVVWTSFTQDGSDGGVFGQRFDAQGNPAGTEFQINEFAFGRQSEPAVAMDSGGSFVATWTSLDQDGSGRGVFGRVYNALGEPLGSVFRVNSTTAGDQRDSAVATDTHGNFAAVWTSAGQDGSGNGVFSQRYDTLGNRVGSEFQVNASSAGDQDEPAIGMDADGNFTTVWSGFDADSRGIIGRQFAVVTASTPEVTVLAGTAKLVDDHAAPVDFGTVIQGTAGPSRTFTVRNDGTVPLTLGALSVPAGFVITDDLVPSLAPGQSDAITITLDTASVGVKSGPVSFATDDVDENPFDIAVIGQVDAGEPEIDVLLGGTSIVDGATAPIDFGTVVEGQAGPELIFTVENNGVAPLTLGSPTVPAGFTVVVDPGANVAPGDSTTFTVRLDSAVVGVQSGDLSLGNNDADEAPFNFAITGTVEAAPTVFPEIAVFRLPSGGGAVEITDGSTTAIDFGAVEVGAAAPEVIFQVRNDGQADLTLDPVSVPQGFMVVDTLVDTLAPGASDTFSVKLDSSSAGDFTGSVSLANNDGDENPFDFAVSGQVSAEPLPSNIRHVPVLFRNGQWFFDLDGAGGTAEKSLRFGIASDVPVLGDWNNDGLDEPAVFRNGTWFFDVDGAGGAAEKAFAFGIAGDLPFAGDFNDDGTTDVGVYRNGMWFFDLDGKGGKAEKAFSFGIGGDKPLAGDFNNDDRSDAVIHRNGLWFFDFNGAGGAAEGSLRFGSSTDKPVAGDFDGNGTFDAGVYRSGLWFFDQDGAGGAGERSILFGLANDVPLAARQVVQSSAVSTSSLSTSALATGTAVVARSSASLSAFSSAGTTNDPSGDLVDDAIALIAGNGDPVSVRPVPVGTEESTLDVLADQDSAENLDDDRAELLGEVLDEALFGIR